MNGFDAIFVVVPVAVCIVAGRLASRARKTALSKNSDSAYRYANIANNLRRVVYGSALLWLVFFIANRR